MHILFIKRLVFTSIGRKALMAVSGLLLGSFMLVHLAENMLLFKGEVFYNTYVDFLLSNPVTPFLELGLLILFILHIVMGAWVRVEDFINAPRSYEISMSQGGRTIGSATMLYTAAALLAYLIYHMLTFRLVDHSMGFYQMITAAFRSKIFVTIYLGGTLALVLHLSHGMQSAFQTLGINHPKYTPFIKLGGWLTALAMMGFAAISIYYLLGLDLRAAGAGTMLVIQ